MIDAEDGKVDIRSYLASARGFFPVPIIITEPDREALEAARK